MNLSYGRPNVWCINWSHEDPLLPRAAVQVLQRSGEIQDAYFPTWEQAMEFANRYAETARNH